MAGGGNAQHNNPGPGEPGFPDYRQGGVAMKYVKQGYTMLCKHALTLILLPLAAIGVGKLVTMYETGELQDMWEVAAQTHLQLNLVYALFSVLGVVLCVLYLFLNKQKPVYLVDFAVYKPPDSLKMPFVKHMDLSTRSGKFDEVALDFQDKILTRSGLGQHTYVPRGLHVLPPETTMQDARVEAEQVMFGAVDEALRRTNLKPKDIGILIVNCSLFNPTPSLAAMVINHFKMGSNVISYNLSGMGCSAGIIAIDLAQQMLQLYPNSYALVVSTENITQNWYFGNRRSKLIPNCIFRMGGAAMVLSNRAMDGWRAKYRLGATVRTTAAASDQAYKCVMEEEDEQGIRGITLSKDLMAIAGEALKINITTLGPLVLPFSEQFLFFASLILRKVLGKKTMKQYIPDFKLAFDHFCIHTGGRAVIEEIEKQLALTEDLITPSKATLSRYGNVSSSSVWYILAYLETKKGVRRGDRIWQIAFGSGFKCNSSVWHAMRNIKDSRDAWIEEDPTVV
eukprot:TRINITY_DN1985_c0_g1_i1.p1 TRINITY_DN1985_c0_g1~~TRINITY_DN1985_c0_g1_i1.p1  ORF type:complete len:532 (-),score=95.35 TRINITY_DN1985_c0_g1_i1:1077-2603(-)